MFKTIFSILRKNDMHENRDHMYRGVFSRNKKVCFAVLLAVQVASVVGCSRPSVVEDEIIEDDTEIIGTEDGVIENSTEIIGTEDGIIENSINAVEDGDDLVNSGKEIIASEDGVPYELSDDHMTLVPDEGSVQ